MWKLLPVALSLSLLAPLPGVWTLAPAYANTTVREVCPPCIRVAILPFRSADRSATAKLYATGLQEALTSAVSPHPALIVADPAQTSDTVKTLTAYQPEAFTETMQLAAGKII